MTPSKGYFGTLTMRILSRLTLAVILAAVAMFVFIKLAHEVNEGETRQIDDSWFAHFLRGLANLR